MLGQDLDGGNCCSLASWNPQHTGDDGEVADVKKSVEQMDEVCPWHILTPHSRNLSSESVPGGPRLALI